MIIGVNPRGRPIETQITNSAIASMISGIRNGVRGYIDFDQGCAASDLRDLNM